ncbi:MAG: amino acid permease, partial [Planctomycetaceae bacterium]|nr:amino acid permease [Planctomycetaceae bacterium]
MPTEFGLGMAIFVVIASMVGVGVLTTSGYTMLSVGSSQYMILLWVLGGVIALSGALTLAELSAALPHTGGDYIYLYHAYGPLAAFLSGWVSFLVGFSGPSALAAFASARYLLTPLGLQGSQLVYAQRALGTMVILIFSLIHVSGRERTAQVQVWVTGLKLALLGILIVAGISVGWPHIANLLDARPVDHSLVGSMLFSLVYIYYAYTGWNGASYLAGEIRDPQRILPRAILIGTSLVTVLYVGVNAVYALALKPADLQALVEDPGNKEGVNAVLPIAEIAARRLFGSHWSNVLSVAIGFMLLSTLSVYLLLGPRVIYAMACTGQFPRVAARLTVRSGTPGVATFFQVALTLLLLWTGSFESIMVYASVGL